MTPGESSARCRGPQPSSVEMPGSVLRVLATALEFRLGREGETIGLGGWETGGLKD